LIYSAGLASETDRAVAAEPNTPNPSSSDYLLNFRVGFAVQERKVRTLQGGEPANGGAFEISNFRFQISLNLRFEISNDDKCNRKQTSRFEISDLRFEISKQVMGEMVRPARA